MTKHLSSEPAPSTPFLTSVNSVCTNVYRAPYLHVAPPKLSITAQTLVTKNLQLTNYMSCNRKTTLSTLPDTLPSSKLSEIPELLHKYFSSLCIIRALDIHVLTSNAYVNHLPRQPERSATLSSFPSGIKLGTIDIHCCHNTLLFGGVKRIL